MKTPSKATLRKYGLTEAHWKGIKRPNCELCDKPFKDRRVFIDHFHAPGFSAMPPEEKRKHVRGLLCYTCNRFKVAKNDRISAARVLSYMEFHESAPYFA